MSLPINRDGIIADNPEKFYEFEEFEELKRKGKMSVCRLCTHKETGEKYAAKIIYYDTDAKFAAREYDFMKKLGMGHKGLVKLHEAYLVRKYLIIIMEVADGPTLLDYVSNSKRPGLDEDVIADIVRQLCEVLVYLHKNNAVHLDIRPTNIRINSQGELKLVDYNSAQFVGGGEAVVDIIGDTEFCAPEMLNFDPVQPGSDTWSVAVITYILLSGISPFYHEDEARVLNSVQSVQYMWVDSFTGSKEAKDFIKKCLVRAPEMRLTAEGALKHTWLTAGYAKARKASNLYQIKDTIEKTDMRLISEEEEEYVQASFVLRTFEEDEYDSPDAESEEED